MFEWRLPQCDGNNAIAAQCGPHEAQPVGSRGFGPYCGHCLVDLPNEQQDIACHKPGLSPGQEQPLFSVLQAKIFFGLPSIQALCNDLLPADGQGGGDIYPFIIPRTSRRAHSNLADVSSSGSNICLNDNSFGIIELFCCSLLSPILSPNFQSIQNEISCFPPTAQ